ncbi:MAG: tetratricopeptide repeat protein, partial [Bacteroidota bacterium]|nr:tetratricopeptide repeat protein [Bacteroidota bacterium]
AQYYANAGLEFARRNEYPMGEGLMLNTLGQINERHGFLEQAESQYLAARSIFRDNGFTKGVATTTNGLGVVAGRRGAYADATRHFLEALELNKSIGSADGIVQTYIKLGVVSDHVGELDQALNYYLQAESLNQSSPSSNATLTLLNNIGIIYGKRNDLPAALRYFRQGLTQSDPEKNTGVHITLLGSAGVAYQMSGNLDSAWYFQQQALSMARQNDLPEEEARALVNLAEIVSGTDAGQTLDLLRQALAITERIHHVKLMTEVYEAMVQIHKKANDYKVAMELSEKMQILKDSLFSVEKAREIAKLHATQELSRQENEIRNLALKNDKSVLQRNIMFVIVLIAAALIAIVWFYNARISTLNSRLMEKQAALKNSNNVKDKLFSVLGHDLRAPLNQVIGLLNILNVKHLDEEESVIIDKLRQQSQNTLDTLDNLLVWGQSQLKGIRLNQQTISVKDQVLKSLSLSDHYAAQKNVRLIERIDSDILVHADPSHFDFVIRNLLSNAIKFSHAGGTVVVNAVLVDGQEVVFSIQDSGVGIAPDVQKKILTHGNESAKGTWNEKGTGIGLVLCREYINENGGKLWLESSEGKGATFYFFLKRSAVKSKPKTATQLT